VNAGLVGTEPRSQKLIIQAHYLQPPEFFIFMTVSQGLGSRPIDPAPFILTAELPDEAGKIDKIADVRSDIDEMRKKEGVKGLL